jgi:hypothetical protein
MGHRRLLEASGECPSENSPLFVVPAQAGIHLVLTFLDVASPPRTEDTH